MALNKNDFIENAKVTINGYIKYVNSFKKHQMIFTPIPFTHTYLLTS